MMAVKAGNTGHGRAIAKFSRATAPACASCLCPAGNGCCLSKRTQRRSGARTNSPAGRFHGVPQTVSQRLSKEQPLMAHYALLRNAMKALNLSI